MFRTLKAHFGGFHPLATWPIDHASGLRPLYPSGPCRTRTGMPSRARDFKSPASAIPPRGRSVRLGDCYTGPLTEVQRMRSQRRAPASRNPPAVPAARGRTNGDAVASGPVSACDDAGTVALDRFFGARHPSTVALDGISGSVTARPFPKTSRRASWDGATVAAEPWNGSEQRSECCLALQRACGTTVGQLLGRSGRRATAEGFEGTYGAAQKRRDGCAGAGQSVRPRGTAADRRPVCPRRAPPSRQPRESRGAARRRRLWCVRR